MAMVRKRVGLWMLCFMAALVMVGPLIALEAIRPLDKPRAQPKAIIDEVDNVRWALVRRLRRPVNLSWIAKEARNASR